MARARPVIWLSVLMLGGCSLIFDGGEYEGGGGADAGAADSGAPDGGPEDASAGADAGRMACTRHQDCSLAPELDFYVCVPVPGSPDELYCAAQCSAPDDCGPVGGGPAHDVGSLCLPSGDCGCETSEHCQEELFPTCDRATRICEETNCTTSAECAMSTPGAVCFGGRCQRVGCATAEDCVGEQGVSACTSGPGGLPPQCSDTCTADTDCPAGSTCPGSGPGRRCT